MVTGTSRAIDGALDLTQAVNASFDVGR